jgi:predicted kinase
VESIFADFGLDVETLPWHAGRPATAARPRRREGEASSSAQPPIMMLGADLIPLLPRSVVALVGMPGAGKSTLAEVLSRRAQAVGICARVVCPDEIARARHGSTLHALGLGEMRVILEAAYRQLEEALDAGAFVVFDATLTKWEEREPIVAMAKRSDVSSGMVVFRTLAAAVLRNERRTGESGVSEVRLLTLAKGLRQLLDRLPSEGWNWVFNADELEQDGPVRFTPDVSVRRATPSEGASEGNQEDAFTSRDSALEEGQMP